MRVNWLFLLLGPRAALAPFMQHTLEELLFQLGLGDLDLHGFIDLLLVTAFVIGIVLDGGREEGVDESRLAKTRLAGNLLRSR